MRNYRLNLRVLVVCSKNSGKIAPFIIEQTDALTKAGVVVDFFCVVGKGVVGYLKNRTKLLAKIAAFQPQIIHAHYGISGLLANTQRNIPVVTTYHGSDIHIARVFWLSKIAIQLSKHNIFVSQQTMDKVGQHSKCSLLPCGVDVDFFQPIDKKIARIKLQLDMKDKFVLFSGSFNNRVKNAHLAHKAVELLNGVYLLELKGYSREEVMWLMNAVDACLMTSRTEGSPQFIKEAMACNCPIVSVNVGDVVEVTGETDGCYIARYQAEDIAEKLLMAMKRKQVVAGRNRLLELQLDNQTIAKRLVAIYEGVLNEN